MTAQQLNARKARGICFIIIAGLCLVAAFIIRFGTMIDNVFTATDVDFLTEALGVCFFYVFLVSASLLLTLGICSLAAIKRPTPVWSGQTAYYNPAPFGTAPGQPVSDNAAPYSAAAAQPTANPSNRSDTQQGN